MTIQKPETVISDKKKFSGVVGQQGKSVSSSMSKKGFSKLSSKCK